MPKKRARSFPKRSAGAVSSDFGAGIAAALVALALAGAALFVDSGAQASFDAPKRLTALVGLALAAAAAFAWPRAPRPDFRAGARAARLAAWLCAAALVWALLASLLSPRREAALDAFRVVLLSGLALPLGASRVVGRRGVLLLGVFLAALAVDAWVSIGQSRGTYRPFQLDVVGMREDTGAFAGNVGYLSIALALGLTVSLGAALYARGLPVRLGGAALGLLFACDLAVNRNLTAILATAAGAVVLLVSRFGRRSTVPLAAAVGLIALMAGAYAPMRERIAHAGRAAVAGDWDRLFTYRGGAWVAAIEMAGERPFVGFGPGSFRAEFVPHRLAAEIRYRRRFVNPLLTSSYGETHCDYLQPFAEIGVPGALAALSAAVLLLAAVFRRLSSASGAGRAEPAVLLSLLAAGATAALLWFPLQRPITALPLLLVAGRAWRLCMEDDAPVEPEPAPASAKATAGRPLPALSSEARSAKEEAGGVWKRLAVTIGLVAALAAAAWPEIPRYLAERKLRVLEGALRYVLTRPSEIADPPAALVRVADLSLQAAAALPADPRPFLLAGGARLANGEGERAAALYRSALALGERAETDLNLGRACDALGRGPEAEAWFVRGGWVSPTLLATLLPDVASSARAEVRRLKAELEAGRLAAPPPLPADSLRTTSVP